MTDFAGLKLADPILRAVKDEGYTKTTPIQSQSIPSLLEGHDLLGVAQTGTGKTASFALPLLSHLALNDARPVKHCPRALILAPTRELAAQIADSLRTYGKYLQLRTTVVFGGTSIRPQIKAMNAGVHTLVATPGRLLDLMEQGYVRLDHVEVFILDEADRMLDMGFINDVKKIAAKVPKKRQTVLFSATMPRSVQGLAQGLLRDPVHVEVAPAATTAEKVEQSVMFLGKEDKLRLAADLMKDEDIKRVLIFTRTKHRADKLVKHLLQKNVEAEAIHGNKSQNARTRALKGFRGGRVRALVATDIAARGIDVDGITHVINFELPDEPESYVHRIGRTARAGATGIAISFCDMEERVNLRDIERTIRQKIEVIEDHPYHCPLTAKEPPKNAKKAPQGKRGQQQKRRPAQAKAWGKAAPGKSAGGHKRPNGSKPNGSRPNGPKQGGKPANKPSGQRRSGGGNRRPQGRAA